MQLESQTKNDEGVNTLHLRQYQQQCIEAIKKQLAKQTFRLLIALPTGTGKTVIFSHLPKALNTQKRTLVLAHREELLDQALDKFQKVDPQRTCGIEQASRRAGDVDIVIASVPTLQNKRLKQLNPDNFEMVIVDEAHHAVAQTYLNIFDHLKLLDKENTKPLIGFTATPKRGDGIGLSKVFDDIAYEASIKEMINANYLCHITGHRILTSTSLDSVEVKCGEFVQSQLSKTVNSNVRNALIVETYKQFAPQRRTLAFCSSIEHAKNLAQSFSDERFASACITGETSRKERKEILEDFSVGRIDVLTNCNVLTEGFDEPKINCLIMARPTKSALLYTQMVGRGTRIHPDKDELMVLDFVDNSSKHSLMTINTLFGLPESMDLKGADALSIQKELEAHENNHPRLNLATIENIDDLEIVSSEIDFFNTQFPAELDGLTNYTWMPSLSGGYRLDFPKGRLEILPTHLDSWITIDTNKETGVTRKIEESDTIEEALKASESYLRWNHDDIILLVEKNAEWRNDPATSKQIWMLRKLGIDIPTHGVSKGRASQIIGLYMANNNSFYNNGKAA